MFAVDKFTGFRCRVLRNDAQRHKALVRFTTGWLCGRRRWVSVDQLMVCS